MISSKEPDLWQPDQSTAAKIVCKNRPSSNVGRCPQKNLRQKPKIIKTRGCLSVLGWCSAGPAVSDESSTTGRCEVLRQEFLHGSATLLCWSLLAGRATHSGLSLFQLWTFPHGPLATLRSHFVSRPQLEDI